MAGPLRAPSLRLSRVYLDDLLQAWDPKTYDKAQLAEWIALLNAHGVVLGAKKCLPPSTRSEWLGLTIDTESMTISVGDEKGRAIKTLMNELLDKESVTTRAAAVVVGKLNSIDMQIWTRPQTLTKLLVRRRRDGLEIWTEKATMRSSRWSGATPRCGRRSPPGRHSGSSSSTGPR